MYGKLFASMFDGSLYGNWQAIVTFQQMIILADKDGTIEITPQALAARTSIPIDIIEHGIAVLESPDPYTRTSGEEGRRITRINPDRPWGWHITNHAHYRAIRTAEERREYHKSYWHKRKDNSTNSTGTQQNQPIAVSSKQIQEADTEAEALAEALVTPYRPDTVNPEHKLKPFATAAIATALQKAKPKNKIEPPTGKTWASYSGAYRRRYGVEPVRNAKVNGQLAQLINRLGADEAPVVAAFYVSHNKTWYVSKKHPVDSLLADAEGLRTEWATGRMVTDTEARQTDSKQSNFNSFAPLIEEARSREENEKKTRTENNG